ncbi:MAG: hypothetical protein AAGL49_06590, partial [Pseudomonadota bacterium]
AGAFRQTLEAARALSDVLWEREAEAASLTTPERRAGFKSRLRALVKGIDNPEVREAYGLDFARRLDDVFRGPETARTMRPRLGGAGPSSREPRGFKSGPTPELRRAASGLASGERGRRRESVLLLTLLNHPHVLDAFGETLAEVRLRTPSLDGLLVEILELWSMEERLDRTGLRLHLSETEHGSTVERLDADKSLTTEAFLRLDAEPDEAEAGLRDIMAQRLQFDVLPAEIREARAELAKEMTAEAETRLHSLLSQQAALARAADEEDD